MVGAYSLSKSKKYSSELPIICQMSKSNKTALWRRYIKKKLDIMRFRHDEVNFQAIFDDYGNTSKCYIKYVFE